MSLQIISPGLPNLLVLSMRWLVQWTGVWSADVVMKDIAVPSGKVTVVSDDGLLSFAGTVDPERSGTFGEKQHVRVVGGGGGWGKPVRAQHFHNDLGVNLQELAQATAAEAGELVNLLAPVILKIDFVRRGLPSDDPGTAAQIFSDAGVDWWVDTSGVTQIGIRPPGVAPLSLTVKDWDPAAGTVSFASSDLVQPGMVVIDTRFGTKTVTAVDATLSEGSIHGTLWLADSAPSPGQTSSELLDSLDALAKHATGADYSRLYEYRVIGMAGDRVNLQAVNPGQGMPDLIPVSVRAGISGYKATLTPSSRVLVSFSIDKQPSISFYEAPEGGNWRPPTLEFDATAAVTIGAQAAAITLGVAASALPVARAPAVAAYVNAVTAAFSAMATAAAATTITPVTGAGLAAFLAPVVAALTSAASALVAACPSTKVIAS